MLFGVPLNTLLSFGRSFADLLLFFVGPGFDTMSPAITSCANLRKLKIEPSVI